MARIGMAPLTPMPHEAPVSSLDLLEALMIRRDRSQHDPSS